MVIYSGFSHWKWWFSIVISVYQRFAGGFNVCLWSSLLFGMDIQNDQAPLSLYLLKIHRVQISSFGLIVFGQYYILYIYIHCIYIYRCKPPTRLQYIRIQPYFSVEGSTGVIVRYGGNFTTFGYWVGGRRRTDSLSWEYMGVSCLDTTSQVHMG